MKMIRDRRIILVGMVVSIIFVVAGCAWLSFSSEKLDEIAEHFGAQESPIWTPPIPDYEIPGLEGNIVVNIALGIFFTLVVLGVVLVVGKGLRAGSKKEA
jgi:hypothetical protein